MQKVKTAIVNNSLAGSITSGGTISASYSIQNTSTVESLTCYVIVAVYDSQGNPYDVILKTVPVSTEETVNGTLDLTLDTTEEDLTGYTASAMVWSDDLFMLDDVKIIN